MPTDHIVALLIAERDKLNQAIAVLSGGVTAKRRGRRPKSAEAAPMISPAPSAAPTTGRRPWTAEQKQAAAERMKKRWAKKRKAAKKS
jgi:hypothetical protein